MKSLALISLALWGGSATASGIYSDNEFRVQGNHNTGILSMNDKNAHMGNNQGIINVFGKDGKKSAPNNNGFIIVLPFHIVRNDDEYVDNELADHLIIKNRKGGEVAINNHGHDDELFDADYELADTRISMPNNRGFITVNQWDDEADNELAISINMSGNSGKVNINSNNPENLKGLVIENNKGVVTTNNSENLKNMVIKNNQGKIRVAGLEEDPVNIPDISGDMKSLRQAMNNMKVAHNKAFLGKH